MLYFGAVQFSYKSPSHIYTTCCHIYSAMCKLPSGSISSWFLAEQFVLNTSAHYLVRHFDVVVGVTLSHILTPLTDVLSFSADVNIADLITVDDAMTLHHLGPNGALIYCMEYLEKNVDWLLERLASCRDKYVLFDFPGQVLF